MKEAKKLATSNKAKPNKKQTTIKPTHPVTKLELVASHLIVNGINGVSALSAFARSHDFNPRNSISKLRKNHGAIIPYKYFNHQHSCGHNTKFKHYWLADHEQVRKVAELVNMKRMQRGATPLSREQIAYYLIAFPISSTIASTVEG